MDMPPFLKEYIIVEMRTGNEQTRMYESTCQTRGTVL